MLSAVRNMHPSRVGRVSERGSFDQDAAGQAAATPTTTARAASTTAPTTTASRRPKGTSVGTAGQAEAQHDGQGTPRGRRTRLPQTAGPLALLELLSGLSVAGGLGLRQLRKRV